MGSDQNSGQNPSEDRFASTKFCSDPFCVVSGDYFLRAATSRLAAEPVPWACAPGSGPLRGEPVQYSEFGETAELAYGSDSRRFLSQILPCFQPAALIGAHTHGTGSAASNGGLV
jgi:hypothetical protein